MFVWGAEGLTREAQRGEGGVCVQSRRARKDCDVRCAKCIAKKKKNIGVQRRESPDADGRECRSAVGDFFVFHFFHFLNLRGETRHRHLKFCMGK